MHEIKIKLHPPATLDKWLSTALTGSKAIILILLFGGDRLRCCDEALIAFDDRSIVGAATIALEGEMGEGPALV
ncbi:MAG: hypothetical protein E3J25_06450, partial [Anaerolineales bacterium]